MGEADKFLEATRFIVGLDAPKAGELNLHTTHHDHSHHESHLQAESGLYHRVHDDRKRGWRAHRILRRQF